MLGKILSFKTTPEGKQVIEIELQKPLTELFIGLIDIIIQKCYSGEERDLPAPRMPKCPEPPYAPTAYGCIPQDWQQPDHTGTIQPQIITTTTGTEVTKMEQITMSKDTFTQAADTTTLKIGETK